MDNHPINIIADDIFDIIQKITDTGVHLKVDEAVEGCTRK